jgi:hypothetical protein
MHQHLTRKLDFLIGWYMVMRKLEAQRRNKKIQDSINSLFNERCSSSVRNPSGQHRFVSRVSKAPIAEDILSVQNLSDFLEQQVHLVSTNNQNKTQCSATFRQKILHILVNPNMHLLPGQQQQNGSDLAVKKSQLPWDGSPAGNCWGAFCSWKGGAEEACIIARRSSACCCVMLPCAT